MFFTSLSQVLIPSNLMIFTIRSLCLPLFPYFEFFIFACIPLWNMHYPHFIQTYFWSRRTTVNIIYFEITFVYKINKGKKKIKNNQLYWILYFTLYVFVLFICIIPFTFYICWDISFLILTVAAPFGDFFFSFHCNYCFLGFK